MLVLARETGKKKSVILNNFVSHRIGFETMKIKDDMQAKTGNYVVAHFAKKRPSDAEQANFCKGEDWDKIYIFGDDHMDEAQELTDSENENCMSGRWFICRWQWPTGKDIVK